MGQTMREATVVEILREIMPTSERPGDETVYDEALREVSARVDDHGSMGKADIGALVVWKRISAQTRWAKQLMETPDKDVRTATARAYVLANDLSASVPDAGGAARSALFDVPGLGGTGAMASAVLLAMSPTRMAVWDRRVSTTLEAIGRRPKAGPGHYARYLEVAVDLAGALQEADDHQASVTPRQVDLVLYQAAGKPEVLKRLRHAAGQPNDAR